MALPQDANRFAEGFDHDDNENCVSGASGSDASSNAAIAVSALGLPAGPHTEASYLFVDRTRSPNSLNSEQAFMHMVKAMLGTGLLSLPLAFKHSGLYLGLVLLFLVCGVCLYCMRQVVYAAHFVCKRNGREVVDYANIMRGAVEAGPPWICGRGYFFKQLVNVTMFVSQLGFCCVYFVFMADNLENFFNQNTSIHLSKAVWMALLLIPMLSICSIRRLNSLAPFALAANVIYICAVVIVLYFFFTNLKPSRELPAVGHVADLPLFFGVVMFAFEGVAVIMPIENRMEHPQLFIAWNGVLNTSCMVVLAIFAVTGFYGYLAVGDQVADTVTLNLPPDPFYQGIKVLFVLCIMVSYPIQFYVPLERVEKWITRKIAAEKQVKYIYITRYSMVILTCAIAEMVPHLALFISLMGAFSGASMALVFPPCIDLLISYAQGELCVRVWIKNGVLLCFAMLGFTTGTYSALSEIFKKFGSTPLE